MHWASAQTHSFQNSHKQHSNPEEQDRKNESEITGFKTLWTQIHRLPIIFLLGRERHPTHSLFWPPVLSFRIVGGLSDCCDFVLLKTLVIHNDQ